MNSDDRLTGSVAPPLSPQLSPSLAPPADAAQGVDSSPPFAVAAFYHFGPLPHYERLQAPLRETCARLGVRGIALLAAEGVNGTMAGSRQAMEEVLETISRLTGFNRLDRKWSTAQELSLIHI